MNIYNEKISILVSFIGTFLTWLFGAWDLALSILVLFIVLDYIAGLIKAFVNKTISSNIGLHGIARKAVIFIVLIVGVSLDRILNSGTWMFRTLVCYFYIANEGISILENCCEIGINRREPIKKALIQLTKEGNKDE